MYLPKTVFQILAQAGMEPKDNPGEFWFCNRDRISEEIQKRFRPTDFQRFESQIRWRTPVGKDAQLAVRKYIEDLLTAANSLVNDAFRQGHFIDPRASFTLDFADFTFESGGQSYTLDDFQNLYANSKIHPNENLSGIDLHGISINHCTLRSLVLSYANLDDAQIGGVNIEDCSFSYCSMRKARLGMIRFYASNLANADLCGAFINAVNLDDHTIPDKLIFKEVSYFYLLFALMMAWFSPEGFSEIGSKPKRQHTVFLFNDSSALSGLRNAAIKNYIRWYEHIFDKLRDFKTLSFAERLSFSVSLIFTKSWTSLKVLATQVLLMNAMFALYYHANHTLIHNLDQTFQSAFYFSIVTFVTLGYGDMYPVPGYAQLAVIFEVALGYISLGSFAFLIGHKVSGRY